MAELRSAGQPRTAVPTRSLFNDLADGAGAHRMAAFTDREPQAFFHRHRRDQLNDQLHVVSRHYHLGARRQLRHSGHVRRPQIELRTTDVTGVAELPSGTEMVMPGDNVQLVIELITPVAMEKGLRFAIREGGHTVGAGTISEIIK